MHNRTDRGLVRAGLAVLVTGLLGGGVLAVVGGPSDSRKLTADGIATGRPVAAAQPLEPAPPRDAPAGEDGPEVGDKVVMGDGSVTVSTVEDDVNAGRLFGAGEGFKYVAAEVKGCSGANEKNITFEPSYFLLRLDDGTIRDAGVGAKKPSLEGGTIPPGKCLSGWVTFTVPDGALPTGVIYDGSTRTTWTVPLPKNAKQTTTTTAKVGATTTTTEDDSRSADDPGSGDDSDSDDPDSTSTTRAKAATTTTTRTKSTATTATTAKSTAKSTSTTATTRKPTSSQSTATTAPRERSTGAASSTTTTTKAPETPKSTTSTTAKEG